MKKIKFVLIIILLTFFSFNSSVFAFDDNNLIKTETKDKVIFIKDNGGKFYYSWTFDKEEYEKNKFDFDLNINFSSSKEGKIDLFTSGYKKQFISFNYHGKLPSTALIKIPVSKYFKNEEQLKLYYYDEKENKIKLISRNVSVINNFVTFQIDHCSDYFLTMSIVREAKDNNSSRIIIGLITIIVAIIGYTLFNKKNKDK